MALKALPPFSGMAVPGAARFVVADRPDVYGAAFSAALAGKLPGELALEFVIPSGDRAGDCAARAACGQRIGAARAAGDGCGDEGGTRSEGRKRSRRACAGLVESHCCDRGPFARGHRGTIRLQRGWFRLHALELECAHHDTDLRPHALRRRTRARHQRPRQPHRGVARVGAIAMTATLRAADAVPHPRRRVQSRQCVGRAQRLHALARL